jgi:hypothetical protein
VRWAGKVGYSKLTEVKPGIWEDVITEVDAFGELTELNEALDSGDAVLPQNRVTTSVSIITDGNRVPQAGIIYFTIRGVRRQLSTMVRQPPRIVLYPGEEYHGPLPDGAPDAP